MLDEKICPNCGRRTEGECVIVNGAEYCCEECVGGDACACPLPPAEAQRELAGVLERGPGHAARDNLTSG